MNHAEPPTDAELDAREAPYIAELKRIGDAIGYGRSCQLLGEAWDDMLERDWGLPRGRGKMERCHDIDLIEAGAMRLCKTAVEQRNAAQDKVTERDRVLRAAFHAVRSYEHGNASTELAAEVCDAIRKLGIEGTA